MASQQQVQVPPRPQGHLWWLHEQVEDVTPEELARRIADPAAHEAMAYVQGTLREELTTTRADEAPSLAARHRETPLLPDAKRPFLPGGVMFHPALER